MTIKQLKKPEQRVDVRYLSTLGIKTYGGDNLYPQRVSDIINASPTGSECLERYARFVEGNGFADRRLAEAVINSLGETADDVCMQCAQDLARYGGFALHVDYNVMAEITDVRSVPFEACRLVEDDDSGYIGNIAYHPDWRGRKTRNGKVMRPNTESIRKFPVFNPRKEVVTVQILAAGGIDNYGGQILYVTTSRGMTYPTAKYDAALTELSTDEGLSNVKYRNVRNNFLTACILINRKSMSADNGESESESGMGDAFDSGYSESLLQFQSDTSACNIMEVTLTPGEDAPEIKEFPVRNFDKDFTATEQSVVERIYSIFEQEPFLAVRNGKLGFSGDVIQDAYNYYSAICGRERRIIERAFAAVMSRWSDGEITADYGIEPLVYATGEQVTINDEIINDEPTDTINQP